MSNLDLIFERARAGDGGRVAKLMASVETPSLLKFTIWSSPQASTYIEDLIAGECPEIAAEFHILRRDGEIAVALYLRLVDGAIFVDNVYADEAARKQQLTNLLIYSGLIDYSQRHPSDTAAFDAFEFDRTIRAWHRYLGGKEHSRRTWWHLPLPPGSEEYTADSEVIGFKEAEGRHQRWGFSQFQVVTSQGRYSVGRLPESYFRLTEPAGATDLSLCRTLAKLDPSRTLFVIGPAEGIGGGGTHIATSVRSSVDLQRVLKRLSLSIPERMLERLQAQPA